MRSLERTVEWLRPLVVTKAWDYCIVWKLGDDPSRFIEWVGCCCGSSHGDCKNVKEETDSEKQNLFTLCKDTFVEHYVRTVVCERLAKCPSSLPLYSGIHGEVAMSNEPKWLSHESIGTQVLIPVGSAMIELFSGKYVPKDQKIIDIIVTQFSTFVEHEKPCDSFIQERKSVRTYSLPYLNFIPSLQVPSLMALSSFYPSIEGSSTGSTPSSSLHVSPTQSIGKSWDLLGCHQNSAIGKPKLKARKRTGKEQFHSKNLVTERKRRSRIKERMFALRALVPNITKMDKASILGDAVDYIHELLKNNAELQDELRILKEEEEEYETMNNSLTAHSGGSTVVAKPTTLGSDVATKQIGVQADVNQIGSREFLLRLVCNQNQGEFTRIMEAVNSLGLQVTDVNVTTCHGRVLNIIKTEAKEKEVEPKNLRNSLLKTWLSQRTDGNAR